MLPAASARSFNQSIPPKFQWCYVNTTKHRLQSATLLNTCATHLSLELALAWPDNNPHCEAVRRAAAYHTNVINSLTKTLQYQYIGTVGSILSEYAWIPPSKLLSCAKPSDCKYSAACWDLMPWWHIKTVGLNGSSSLVTVRPQSRILQNTYLIQCRSSMPSLVRKQCRTGNHETRLNFITKCELMCKAFYVLRPANIRILHMHAQGNGKFNIKHPKMRCTC